MTTVEEFKEQTKEDDMNILKKWSTKHFRIVCSKCNSEKVLFQQSSPEYTVYSEYTGEWINGSTLVKCLGCGNAMTITEE